MTKKKIFSNVQTFWDYLPSFFGGFDARIEVFDVPGRHLGDRLVVRGADGHDDLEVEFVWFKHLKNLQSHCFEADCFYFLTTDEFRGCGVGLGHEQGWAQGISSPKTENFDHKKWHF